jgi:DNA ligase (NAD+)
MITISVLKLSVGDRVVVDVNQGLKRPMYYLGTVEKVGRLLTIDYDDGDVGESSVQHIIPTMVKDKNPNRILMKDLDKYQLNIVENVIENPTSYAQLLDLNELIKQLDEANTAYHNGGKSKLTDRQFDLMLDVLKRRDPKNKLLTQIGSPVSSKQKVQLPVRMTSLDKIKENADEWLLANKGPYVIMDKLDGVSLEIDTTEGLKLYTRGDGNIGQDISHLIKYLAVPTLDSIKKIGSQIRAEILMPKAKFKQYESQFANPRNLISGLANKKVADPILIDADIVAYEILAPRMTKSTQLNKLKLAGFKVPFHQVSASLDQNQLSELLKSRKSKSVYELDGLVIEQDKVNQIPRTGNPKYAVAFKDVAQNESSLATVIGVEWNISKGGLLKPTVLIDTVKLAGVNVSRATGFNAKFIFSNGIGIGSVVEIIRSGDVIPHIVKVIKKVKPLMPSVQFNWTPTKVDAVIVDVENDEMLVKQLAHFFRTIGVEGSAESTMVKLVDSGIDTIQKIVKAKPEILQPIIGQVNGQKLHDSIKTCLLDIDLAKLMDASGLFGRGLGTRKAEAFIAKYPDVMDNSWSERDIKIKAMGVVGFSDITATQFSQGLIKFKEFVKSIPVKIKAHSLLRGNKLEGEIVVFTGFRDANLEHRIVENGGKVGVSLTRLTTILLLKDVNSTSDKAEKARIQGIKLMNKDQFLDKYNI